MPLEGEGGEKVFSQQGEVVPGQLSPGFGVLLVGLGLLLEGKVEGRPVLGEKLPGEWAELLREEVELAVQLVD